MKRFITLVIAFIAASGIALAQQQEIAAHFFSKSPITLDATGNSMARFGLTATADQMGTVNALAAGSPQKFVLAYALVADKPFQYDCTLHFKQEGNLMNLHKTLLHFGVTHFFFEGTQYPINDMLTIFK